MNTDTLFLFSYFLEYVLLFLEDNVDEECEWFKSYTSRYSLTFACISVTYKSVAYKKSLYYVETKIIWDYIFLYATRIRPISALKDAKLVFGLKLNGYLVV